jgi:Tol biopolymer transport system component
MKLGLSGAISRLEDEPEGTAGQSAAVSASAPPSPDEVWPVDDAPARAGPVPSPPSGRGSWRPSPALALLLGAVVVAGVLLPMTLFGVSVTERPVPPEYRLSIDTPVTGDSVSLAVSPDGRSVVFVASDGNRSSLWLRPMASTVATPLAGTEGAAFPFWSPDSRHVAFFAAGVLRRIGIGGDPPQTVAVAPNPCGGAWQPDGTILLVPDCDGGIARVSAAGGPSGDVEWLTGLEDGESGHRFPSVLPEPALVLFLAAGHGARVTQVLSLRTGERRTLFASDSAAWYASGHLLHVRDRRLLAVPFDVDRLETGEPFLVAENVAGDAALGAAALSLSPAGPIVFRTGPPQPGGRLAFVDRAGNIVSLSEEAEDMGDPAIAPDGRRLAFRQTVNGNADIWILDLARNLRTRFTFDAAADDRPLWSPDAQRILFRSQRGDRPGLYVKEADGAGTAELLFEGSGALDPTDWSPDGRLILANSRSSGRPGPGASGPGGWGVVLLDVESGQWDPVVDTPFDERDGQMSPDGRWIAYESNQSGRPEVFLRPFPDAGGVRQVSTGGGMQPRWSPDGRELFYLGEDGVLLAVTLQVPDEVPDIGRPVRLFGTDTLDTHAGSASREIGYAVTPDGRFVFVAPEQTEPDAITVLLNWQARPR